MLSSFFAALILLALASPVLPAQTSAQAQQNCTVRVRSKLATAVRCDSHAPSPFGFGLSIQFTQTVSWKAGSSWKYALEDANHHLTPLDSHCSSYQGEAGSYFSGTSIGMGAECSGLPRELRAGDSWWVYVFGQSSNPDHWLMVTIPIRNETTSKVKMPLSSPNLLSLASG